MKKMILLLTLLIISCDRREVTVSNLLKPEWRKISVENLPLKFGEKILISVDDEEINAIVVDFDKDEAGIWYGLSFLNHNNIFGRTIPSGFNGDCVDLIDVSYLNSKALHNYISGGIQSIDRDKVAIGSKSPVTNYSELARDYKLGIEQRKKKPTSCNEDIISNDVVRERYFDLSFLK